MDNGACVKQISYHWECSKDHGTCDYIIEKDLCIPQKPDFIKPKKATGCGNITTQRECERYKEENSHGCLW